MTKKLSLFILLILISTASEAAWLSPVKLTDNYAADQVPAISGDGSVIAFQTRSDVQGRYGFGSLIFGQYFLTFFKRGYSMEYCLIDYGGESITRDFTLQTVQ